MSEIIRHCLLLDCNAAVLYDELSRRTSDPQLQRFWREMAAEERTHVSFWEAVLPVADDGVLAVAFPDPEETVAELRQTLEKTEKLAVNLPAAPTVVEQFSLAFRMEFFLLHPAFETVFQIMEKIVPEGSPLANYDHHLSGFIGMLASYGQVSSELELLGETLLRLWHQNRILAMKTSRDPLTGVLNRHGLASISRPLLHLAARNETAVGIVMVDVDDFKRINDTRGHQTGDDVLRFIGQAIRTRMRRSDIICRYGGEEFLLVLFEISPGGVLTVGEKLRQAIEGGNPFDFPLSISVGLSVGVVSDPVEHSFGRLVAAADEALYRAKGEGKNRVETAGDWPAEQGAA